MKSTKIIILTPGFPKDEIDINCIPSLQLLVQEMNEVDGVKIQIISTQYPFQFGTYQWHNIPVHACGGANRRYLFKALTYLKAIWFLLRFGRNASVVHGFWLYECGLLAAFWGWCINALSVVTVPGQDSKAGNGYFGIMRWWRKMKHLRIVSISDFGAKQLFQNAGIETDAILPYGMHLSNLPTFDPTEERTMDVMGAGSLVPVKNYMEFLEVIALVKLVFPNIKACIAGGGFEQEMLSQRILALGISKNMELTGEIPRTQVLERMSRSKIFLHTALWEGQGFVLIESLAMGMYCVATSVGWLPPSDKSFALGSSQEMAEIIIRILKNSRNHEPVPVLTMKETVANYLRFYDQNIITT